MKQFADCPKLIYNAGSGLTNFKPKFVDYITTSRIKLQ